MNEKTIKILKALADETRLKIVKILMNGERCVCEIFPYVKRTQSTVSIHLNNLEKNGILESRREGKKIYYKIKDNRVTKLIKLLEEK
ncbi:MAG: metalloregulator ArsR/SmtB family transcription factor [Candidatus Pacearchaeota archaeon]